MFSDENKASSLARFLTNYDYVILDTCSLMEDSFPSWLDTLNQAKDYLTEDFVITVPEAAVAELKKHSHDRKNVDKRIPAIRALKIYKEAKRLKLLVASKKSHNQNFADNAIYSQVCEDRLTKKILVITQDKKLATDLKNLNNLNSQRGRKVSVFKVNQEGSLEPNYGEEVYQKRFTEKEKKQLREKERAFAEKNIENFKKSKDFKPNDPLDESMLKALQADARLNANLKNPNYPKESKISDIESQLALLSTVPQQKKAPLLLVLDEPRLKQSLQSLKGAPTPAPAKTPSVTKPSEPKPEETKRPTNKADKADVPTILVKAPAKKLWYGEGVTLPYALDQVAEHYGLLFRDVSIPYLSFIHGPVDVTQKDREQILGKLFEGFKQNNNVEFKYSSFLIKGEKSQKGFKVYLDLNPVSSVQPETEKTSLEKAKEEKPSSITKEEKAEKPETKPEKKEAQKPAEKAEKPRKTSEKPLKPSTSTVKMVPNTSAAVPEGVTLVVGVPTDERKRGWIERSARRDAMGQSGDSKVAAKPKKATKKATAVKPTAEKAKTQTPKPASEAKASKAKKSSPAENAPTKKAVKKSAEKKKEKPITSPEAKSSNKPVKAPLKKKASPVEEALREEKKLRANLGNSNYPSASKKADLKKQIERIGKLSKEDQGKLGLGADALKTMLSIL